MERPNRRLHRGAQRGVRQGGPSAVRPISAPAMQELVSRMTKDRAIVAASRRSPRHFPLRTLDSDRGTKRPRVTQRSAR